MGNEEEVTAGEEEKPETGDLRPEAGKKSNEWERTSQMTAEDFSGITAGGSFNHRDFRENKVFSYLAKNNIMFLNALL